MMRDGREHGPNSPEAEARGCTNGMTLDFSRPGKPTDNAYIEALNGRYRAECLNTHWFLTLADARERLEEWRTTRIGRMVPSATSPDPADEYR